MTLRDCPPGDEVLLCRSTAGPAYGRRFAERGLVPGARLRVVSRGPGGGLIVALDDGRLALDGRTAATLIVEPDGRRQPRC